MAASVGGGAYPSPGRVPWWRRALTWLDVLRQGRSDSAPTWRVPAATPEHAERLGNQATSRGNGTAGGEGPSLGAHAAVDALYRAYAPTVLKYLYHRLPTAADAEDALADVFIAALRATATNGETPGLSWLMRVARNRAVDYYRASGRRTNVLPETHLAELIENPALGPEQRALRSEELRQLAALVNALPEEQREALLLRFGAGMRSAQIAATLGKSDEATRQLISRALRQLRKEWRA